ncbi:MAG TPA: amidohydrolase family protein [Dehalococcoidia bacterium]
MTVIDAHAHVTGPMEMYEYFRGYTNVHGPVMRGFKRYAVSDDRLEATLAPHFAEVGAAGTDLQLVSPRPWAVPTAERRVGLVMTITQSVNDMVAQCARLYPDRFVAVGALPQCPAMLPKDAIAELERCVTELGMVGVKINPDPGEGGTEVPDMGSEYWYPLYERMVALDVPGLIHGGPYRFSREPELGYFCQEETVAGWALARSRVFRDFPDLKLIVAHGGGYIPYQFGRARCFRLNERGRGAPDPDWEPFEDTLRRLYFDTVLFDQEALELLLRVCGVDRCLFGSDKPANGSVVDPRSGRALNDVKPLIDGIPWLADTDRQAIYEGNVRQVYSRLRERLDAP